MLVEQSPGCCEEHPEPGETEEIEEAPAEEAVPEVAVQEADPVPEHQEAVREIRIEAPDTRTGPPITPAGSIGSMARVLGFVLTVIAVLGGITRVQDPDTIETLSQELK